MARNLTILCPQTKFGETSDKKSGLSRNIENES